jgi:hypothetical protein
MTNCPRCGATLASGQEYCLACGARVGSAVGTARSPRTGWIARSVAAGLVALLGAVAAVAATGSDGGGAALITATGGFATAPASGSDGEPVGPSALAEWPTDEEGWTIALAALPQTSGRAAPLARARAARRKDLPQVGILDSSRYASLHPGYWIVFSGVYASEAEATSALEDARRASRTAVVRHVVP